MRLHHGRVTLALYEIRPGNGPAVLLLHELYGRADDWRTQMPAWSGPVYALDFCGHGESDAVAGGAYFAELLAGDADRALDHCGAIALAGAGVGAYVSLLLSAARAERVRGALLLPGCGLSGGAASPRFDRPPPLVEDVGSRAAAGPDPLLYVLERDVRPIDYATSFASRARRLLLAEDGTERPPWWNAVREGATSTVITDTVDRAFAELARCMSDPPF